MAQKRVCIHLGHPASPSGKVSVSTHTEIEILPLSSDIRVACTTTTSSQTCMCIEKLAKQIGTVIPHRHAWRMTPTVDNSSRNINKMSNSAEYVDTLTAEDRRL